MWSSRERGGSGRQSGGCEGRGAKGDYVRAKSQEGGKRERDA